MPLKDALSTDNLRALASMPSAKLFMILSAIITIYIIYATGPYLGPLSEATARRMLGEGGDDVKAIRAAVDRINADHEALRDFRGTVETLAENVQILSEKVNGLAALSEYKEENFIRSVDIAMQVGEVLKTYRKRLQAKRLEVFRLHDGRPDIVWAKNTGLESLFYSCYVDNVRPGARSYRPDMQRLPAEAFTPVNARLTKKNYVLLRCGDVVHGSLLDQFFERHGVTVSLFYPIYGISGAERYLGFLKADYDDLPDSKQSDAGLYFEKRLMKNAATAVAASLIVVLRKDFR